MLADPYILLEDGIYYAYGTYDADGIRCYTSTDLKYWQYSGLALNKANTTENRWFWAPEVYHVGDRYIMYYSANEHLFAATASSPKGPFRQVGSYQMESLLKDEKCIDSHVFFDTDGSAYLFFVRFNNGNCIWQVKLADDCITPVPGTLKQCLWAADEWELKMGRVTEGPNVYKSGARYLPEPGLRCRICPYHQHRPWQLEQAAHPQSFPASLERTLRHRPPLSLHRQGRPAAHSLPCP